MKNSAYSLLLLVLFATGCAQENDYVVTIHTPYGNMTAILYDETPKHKANFIKLAKEHYYDSLLFHRVIQGFMIQGGDPLSRHAPPAVMLGLGDPGYSIDAEINTALFHERGALSAARLGDAQNPTKASNGSQFYIVQGTVLTPEQLQWNAIDRSNMTTALSQFEKDPANAPIIDTLRMLQFNNDVPGYQNKIAGLIPRLEKYSGLKIMRDISPEKREVYTTQGGTPNLDGEYTVFGKVVKGLEVIDSIAKQPTDFANRPTKDINMVVTVEEMPKTKITELYGYTYTKNKK